MTEDAMVGWHHQLDAHEFEQALGEGKGYPLRYSGLENSMDCMVRGAHKELDMTE